MTATVCIEVEELTLKVSDRDMVISQLRQQSTDAISQLEKTHMTELLALKEERDQLLQQINDFRSVKATRIATWKASWIAVFQLFHYCIERKLNLILKLKLATLSA